MVSVLYCVWHVSLQNTWSVTYWAFQCLLVSLFIFIFIFYFFNTFSCIWNVLFLGILSIKPKSLIPLYFTWEEQLQYFGSFVFVEHVSAKKHMKYTWKETNTEPFSFFLSFFKIPRGFNQRLIPLLLLKSKDDSQPIKMLIFNAHAQWNSFGQTY